MQYLIIAMCSQIGICRVARRKRQRLRTLWTVWAADCWLLSGRCWRRRGSRPPSKAVFNLYFSSSQWEWWSTPFVFISSLLGRAGRVWVGRSCWCFREEQGGWPDPVQGDGGPSAALGSLHLDHRGSQGREKETSGPRMQYRSLVTTPQLPSPQPRVQVEVKQIAVSTQGW